MSLILPRIASAARALVAACALLAACGESPSALNATVVADIAADVAGLADTASTTTADAAGTDAAAADARPDVAPDAIEPEDALPDAAEPDTALPDSAEPDAALPDTAEPDAAADAPADATPDAIADAVEPADADDVPDAAPGPDAVDAVDVAAQPTCTTDGDCAGKTPYCDASGACAACVFNAQCPGDGAFCSNGTCSAAVNCVSDKECTALGAVCDIPAGVCRNCLTAADCSQGQSCNAHQCVASTPCLSSKQCPGALICVAGTCVVCGADSDCPTGQFCSQNICLQDICQPGAHCELNAVATCQANGGGWTYADCGLTAICLNAACAPVVCTPGAVTCQTGSVATCNATGTQVSLSACPGGQTCVGKGCIAVICAAGDLKCDASGGLLTCSADGTQWLGSTCQSGFACAAGACQPQICVPGAATCSGDKLLTCTSLGLSWSVAATCSDTGQVCLTDKCVSSVCTAGQLQCAGTSQAKCNADGLGWTTTSCDDNNGCTNDTCNPVSAACAHTAISCDDNNGCTNDTCNPVSAACAHTAISCDDGNSCTTDSCSGTCQHLALSGPACDDGNACTTGEVCTGGICAPPSGATGVSTVAGSGTAGNVNGPGSSASFGRPYGLTRLADGSFVITEYDTHRLRRIQADGTVSALAGTGSAGAADGLAASATFDNPTSVAADAAGNLFIADLANSRIRELSGGSVSTFAGGTAGFKDDVGTAAQFTNVQDIKFDAGGVLWAADRGNHRVRRIAADGTVTTAAGTGVPGYLDGSAAQAQFNEPCRIAPAADGSVYIADCSNYRIRKLSADGTTVSTVSGSGSGFLDGVGSSAKFGWIGGLAWLGGTLIVSDNANNRIRAVAGDGSVSTLAGSGAAGYVDGVPSSAAFSAQWNVAPDWSGALWVADGANQRIRKLSFATLLCNDGNTCTTDACGAQGCVFTPVGNGAACSDGNACTSNDACTAGQCQPGSAVTVCDDQNPCTIDFCNPLTGNCVFNATSGPCQDNNLCTTGEHCVSGACIADTATLVTFAGAATAGFVDGAPADARFNAAFGLALTKSGGTYVSDAGGNRIRLVSANGTTSTVAGTGIAGFLDGAATTAQFNNPTRMVLNAQGDLLIADGVNNRIRKLSGTTVSTVAGSGTAGFLDGAGSSAQFNSPFGLALLGSGVLYVADSGNHRIRTVAANGTVGTLAGSSTAGNADGSTASATFNSPRGLCQASNGTLYVVDTLNHNVRRILGGQVSTLAGSGTAGSADGTGTAASFNQPRDCTVDPSGNVYVTDTFNNRLRRITPTGVVSTVAGSTIGNGSYLTGTDGAALTSVLAYPAVPAWASGGVIWIADNNAIRKFIPANVDCSDGLPCTTDVCNGSTGACVSVPTPTGGACIDGKLCVLNETCTGGVCGGGTANTCDDGDKCTIDSCSATAGCQHVKSTTLPGCCNPSLFQTGFEGDNGNGIALTQAAGTTMGWAIGTSSKAHTGSGAMSITTLNSNGTATATLPNLMLPAGASTLSFWLYYDAVPDTCDSIFTSPCGTATFELLVNGVQVSAQSVATGGWIQVTVSSSLIGGTAPTVQLVFATAASTSFFTYNYASSGSGVFVDDIQVTSACQ